MNLEIWGLNLNENIDEKKIKYLMTCIDDVTKKKIEKNYDIRDSKRSLFGNVLLRYLICKEIQVKNDAIRFSYNKFGKPYLEKYREIEFNVTHSGNWVFCVLSIQRVGIDIEIIKKPEMRVAQRVFSAEDMNELNTLTGFEKATAYYRIWTKIESYIKAEGLSIFHLLDRRLKDFHEYNMRKYFYKHFRIDKNYILTVCSYVDQFPHKVKVIKLDVLCNEFFGID